MKRLITNSVASASILLFFFSGISRVIGFAREIVFASNFGLSNQYDNYLVASVIPITINTIFLFIGQNFFIPSFIELKIRDKRRLNLLLRISVFYFLAFGFVVAAILYFLAPSILYLFHNTEKNSVDFGVQLFRILVMTIPLSGVISILSAFLQAEKNYFLPAISSLILNIMIVAVVIVVNNRIGVFSIVIGYLIGTVCQMIFLIFFTDMIKRVFYTTREKFDEHIRLISSSIILIIIIESVGQLYSISDRLFVSQVKTGGIAAINYAQTIISLPISIITLSLSTAIFPRFSSDYHSGFQIDLEHGFKNAISITLLIFIPISILFHFMSTEIISLFYQRGVFNSNDTRMTKDVFLILNSGLVIYAVYSIFNKIFYSAKLIFILFLITTMGIAVKIASNIVFVDYFGYEGLAFGTVLSYIFFFLSSLWALSKKFRFNWIKGSLLESITLLSNGLLTMMVVKLITSDFSNELWIIMLLKLSVFITIFILNLYLINFPVLIVLVERLKNKHSTYIFNIKD